MYTLGVFLNENKFCYYTLKMKIPAVIAGVMTAQQATKK